MSFLVCLCVSRGEDKKIRIKVIFTTQGDRIPLVFLDDVGEEHLSDRKRIGTVLRLARVGNGCPRVSACMHATRCVGASSLQTVIACMFPSQVSTFSIGKERAMRCAVFLAKQLASGVLTIDDFAEKKKYILDECKKGAFLQD